MFSKFLSMLAEKLSKLLKTVPPLRWVKENIIMKNSVLYHLAICWVPPAYSNLFINYIVFHILAVLRVLRFPPAYYPYRRIAKMKNRYKGKRCFIVCPGPSLTAEDVEKLDSEITFALNLTFRIYEKTDWRPTHYFFGEPATLVEKMDGIKHIDFSDFCKQEFFSTPPCRGKLNLPNPVFIPTSWLDHWYCHKTQKCFSINMLWGCYDAYTSTNNVIALAAYLGCKDIYILGADNKYKGEKPYFAEKGFDNTTIVIPATQKDNALTHTIGFDFVSKQMKQRGYNVCNATRGGFLESFDRVDFDSLFPETNTNS